MKAVYMGRSIEKSLAEGVSTKKGISLIREFVNKRRTAVGISLSRSNTITYPLVGWQWFLLSYEDLTTGDVYTGREEVNNGLNSKGTLFMQNTENRGMEKAFIFRIISMEKSVPAHNLKRTGK